MADTKRVTSAKREQVLFEVAFIGKLIEAREKKGLTH
jgi:hypothetical protein